MSVFMARISPLVTLVLGYILGYVLYPVLQAWTCSCFYDEDADITAHAQSVVARRAAMMREDKSFYDRAQAHRPIKYATWRQFFGTRAKRRGSGQPAHLSSEYTVRGRLYIAIITTEKFLATRAKAIHETWARDIDSANRIVFYVGSDCNTSYSGLEKMSIVRLENVPDSVYPPQRKVFAALQHMYRYHGNSYQWFVRADDDVYIRVMRLDRLLGRLDPNEKVYLGRAGVGKKQDMKRLQLRSHEHYCMGGPGVVLSRATLNAVAPYLGRCLNAVEAHNRIGKGVEGGVWFNEDVELGRCISRTVGIQCSNSEEVKNYFVQDYESVALRPATLWGKPLFQQLITLHPIKEPEHMYSVHQYYAVLGHQAMHKSLVTAQNNIVELCSKIPSYLLPHKLHICSVK